MSGMSAIDLAFLLAETDDSPKHVAGLQIFRKPPAEEGYLGRLYRHWQSLPATPPFNQRPFVSLDKLPGWEHSPGFDPARHLFLHRLPAPGSRSRLLALLRRLHSRRLAGGRPLWECHLIDGLAGQRFAVYIKVHHSYGDGFAIEGWMKRSLSPRPDQALPPPFWNADELEQADSPGVDRLNLFRHAAAALEAGKLGIRQGLRWMGAELGVWRGGVAPPFTASRTPLNTRLGPDRELVIMRFPLAPLQRMGRGLGCTLNDLVLTLCDEALSTYFRHHGCLPERPLVAQLPVSVREISESDQGGNRVALALVRLGEPGASLLQRLDRVHSACTQAKEEVHSLSSEAMSLYLGGLAVLVLGAESLGLGSWLPPLGNVLVSNVEGPRERLYLGAAPMMEAYPLSTLMPSLALNITVYSYAGTLFVGMVCDPCAMSGLTEMAALMRRAHRRLVQDSGS